MLPIQKPFKTLEAAVTNCPKVWLSMKVEDLKWYSPFVFLVGAILSFADPITDILTLVEFYRADHKTWFGVGLAFVILPCLFFGMLYFIKIGILAEITSQYSCVRTCTQTFLCGFHPFSAAFARLEGFVYSLKIQYKTKVFPEDVASETDPDELLVQANVQLKNIDSVVLFESLLESLPQFIIQLYAVSVQEEPVEIIQIISLPVSFLSLAWSTTILEEMAYTEFIGSLKIKHKLVLVLLNTPLMACLIFSYCYFMVSYKWWVIGVLLFNLFAGLTGRFILYRLYMCRGGDVSANRAQMQRKVRILNFAVFVLPNYFMILMFYFSQSSKAWYALPATIFVCVFSVFWCIMRVVVSHFLYKKRSNDGNNNP